MFERAQVREGMVVHSQDGHRLGRVLASEDDGFQVEKGLFFVKDYACSYSEIADIRGDDIFLKHGKEALHRISKQDAYGPHSGVGPEPESKASGSTHDTVPPTPPTGTGPL